MQPLESRMQPLESRMQPLESRMQPLESRMQPLESRSYFQLSNWILHQVKTKSGVRSHRNLSQFISRTWPIDISINLFIFDSLYYLIASRMMSSQRLHIIYIISKNNIISTCIQLRNRSDRPHIFFMFILYWFILHFGW